MGVGVVVAHICRLALVGLVEAWLVKVAANHPEMSGPNANRSVPCAIRVLRPALSLRLLPQRSYHHVSTNHQV